MVDVPFVSEDFQRAFRNQFPAQQSSGRDLHVSDVVVPVVDFTPTASGASLPLNLRFAINKNISVVTVETDGTGDWITDTGFFQCNVSYVNKGDDSDLSILFQEVSSGTNTSCRTFRSLVPSDGYSSIQDTFIIYNPVGFKIIYSFSEGTSSTARADLYAFSVADVNGNLTEPYGYSPQ